MVPVPPMTPAWKDDGITGSALYYDEDTSRSRGDGIAARSENNNFDAEVAAAEAQMAQPPASPAPAASAPTPQTTAVSQAAVGATHLTLDGETYFAFNKSELTALGREQLDKMHAALSNAQYESILITGHTDRLGADAYNKKLSERRALEVKRYLSKKGVDANKIQTKWVGAAEPQTAPGACEGMNRKETIQCLAPDRRVELEVVGVQDQASARR
jgi:OOP family OmpA-OmpF porin